MRRSLLTVRYAIRGIPTLSAFKGSGEVAREVGAAPKPRLEALLDRAASV